ncbi:MAG: T9SS type A sorting domain-containing protein [Flavobacteriales bacterium]
MKASLLFLGILCSFWVIAQQNPTIGEIYDYEVGDLFQYTFTSNFSPPNFSQTYVADKWFSDNLDSVFYEISSSYIYLPFAAEDDLISEFDVHSVISYTNLDSVLAVSGPVPILNEVDSISSFCVINFDDLGNDYMTYDWSVACLDTVYQVNQNFHVTECIPFLSGIDTQYSGYTRGLGRVESFYGGWELGNWGETVLTYWSKSGQECGAYYEPLSVSESEGFLKLNVYPNPSLNGVFFLDSKELTSYEIYNSTGKLILKSTEQNASQIDLSPFSSGAYFLYIFNKNGSLLGVKRLVK